MWPHARLRPNWSHDQHLSQNLAAQITFVSADTAIETHRRPALRKLVTRYSKQNETKHGKAQQSREVGRSAHKLRVQRMQRTSCSCAIFADVISSSEKA